MKTFELGHAKRLFMNALGGNEFSVDQFMKLLAAQFKGANGASGNNGVSVDRYGGITSSPQASSERIMRSMMPLATSESAPTSASPPGGNPWAPVTDIWLPTNRDENVEEGRIVTVARGPIAWLAQPRATTVEDRRVPIGVVAEKLGAWVRVRRSGRCFVQMETDDWRNPDSDEIWLSESSDGIGTEIMPNSARNGIVLVGYRMGAIKNNRVEALVVPAVLPAVWRRVWEKDASNYIDLEYIATRSGYWRMVFVISGVCQAILDETGFRMRGQVYVNPYTSDTQDSANNSRLGQIEYVWDSTLETGTRAIEIQVPHQGTGTYTRVAELNGNGDMLVGAYATGVTPIPAASSADFSGACYGTTGGSVDLTLDGVQAWMRFERISTGADPVNARWEVKSFKEDVVL